MSLRRFISTTVLIAVAMPAIAIDDQNAPPRLAEQIVVTASAEPEALEETPASVTVITREKIESSGALDVADLLRTVPGMQLSRTGSNGKATSLFSRGANSTHTLVLWNGIELNDPYFSGFDWGRFSTAGVERIEVVRGPFSALYGSDAVAGVVNILTSGEGSGTEGRVALGERGLVDAAIRAGVDVGDLALSAAVEHREDDGWARNDDFTQNVAMLSGEWRPVGSVRLGLAARLSEYDLGIPLNSSADGTKLVASPRRRQEGEEAQLALPIHYTGSGVRLELIPSRSMRDDSFADPDDPFGFTEARTESVTDRLAAVSHWKVGPGTLAVGGEIERSTVDDASSYGVSLDGRRRSSESLFAEHRGSSAIGGWGVEYSAGARYDEYDTFGDTISPRVAVAMLRGASKVRVAYGEGFRAPSIGELYFPFSGNESLMPEESRSVEAGIDRWIGDRSFVSLTLFRGDYRNLIVFDNASFRFANVGKASTHGAEVGSSIAIGRGLVAGVNYTWLETEEGATGEPLLRRPRHSGSIEVAWSSGPWAAGLTLLHSGVRADILPVIPFARIEAEAHTTVDLLVSREIGSLRPYLRIENVTGAEYEEVRGFPSPGRRMSIGTRFDF